jgi:hypothetical protein
MLGHQLSAEEEKTAGPLVHYVYGTGIGALYGGLAQKHETIKLGFGVAYGAAAWARGDEIAVPALGLGGRYRWYQLPLSAPVIMEVSLPCPTSNPWHPKSSFTSPKY